MARGGNAGNVGGGLGKFTELRQRLTELGARVPVRVDFTRTVDLSDHALAEAALTPDQKSTASGSASRSSCACPACASG